ncbi:hypothetical protein jaqu_28870 [Jannaschia aquimarina]|uniref:Uncharacterized protein n=1 Tax=Jannaschia aquimarina TaxID=935700 RepID=A0A0D1D631_9RHOB|nr:hypothetical protein jaqu_28870 [Jannaschia aquimarina]SNT22163.1 hypothetical protein SAMN05421775_10827 [Jannaschia aquimarina]
MKASIPLAAIAFSCAAASASAQQNCAPRVILTDRLNQAYGEVFSGGGLQSGDAIIEVWTSPEDGSWAILLTKADGTSCIMAAGTDWQRNVAGAAAPGAPA